MKRNKLSPSFAKLLRSLMDAEVNYAEFSSAQRKLIQQFIDDEVVDFRIVGTSQKRYRCPDRENLNRYLHHKFDIASIDDYIAFHEREVYDRSDAVRATSDSKARKKSMLRGFMVNAFQPLVCSLDGRGFTVTPRDGAFTFVNHYKTFTIPHHVTVVIVENLQNFRDVNRQRYLFTGIEPLFVWRYRNSNAIATWLNIIPNNYIHYGDFDLKGIHIYLSEFREKITGDRGSFLLPEGLDAHFENHGSHRLFDDQQAVIPSLRRRNLNELSPLFSLILRLKKGLSQEVFIR